ncbi:MAG: flagellar motor switch protein FliG [Firmicutes bacterium]|nr:flagellar motor switch protein FliG [Bacillota bacterium]
MPNVSELTGRQKAAVLMIALGPEVSSRVLKHLREDEIEDLTLEIAGMRRVFPDVKDMVLEEFSEMYQASDFISRGGVDYAREMLSKALGEERAEAILHRLTSSLQVRPFDFARRTDAAQILSFIQNEHPQTIALIMAYLEPDQAGIILSALSPDLQVEVARRLSVLDRTSPEVLREIEAQLEKRLSSFVTEDFSVAGGLEAAVNVLNNVDRGTEKTILDALEESDPDLVDEIRKRMFVFEDIVRLDDRSIQQVFREVESRVWALALKTAGEEVSERIYRNISKRAGEMLREEIEYMGPVRLRDVEEAQQTIVAAIRRLEDAGEIVIYRGGEDEVVV